MIILLWEITFILEFSHAQQYSINKKSVKIEITFDQKEVL